MSLKSHGAKQPFKPERCSELVGRGRGIVTQCRHRAVLVEAGKGWCRVHAPSLVNARHARQAAKYAEENELSKQVISLGQQLHELEKRMIGLLVDYRQGSNPEVFVRLFKLTDKHIRLTEVRRPLIERAKKLREVRDA